jgi:site-specific recombinase XerD
VSQRLTTERALALLLHERRARAYAQSTVLQEQSTLRRLLPRLGKPLARVTKPDLEALLAERLKVVKPATAARDLSGLRELYRVLVRAGEVNANPTDDLRVRLGTPSRLLLSLDEVRLILAEASRPPRARRSPEVCRAFALRNRAALEVLYGLALRAGEVCGLTLLDLDLAGRCVFANRVKGCAPASLPLPEAAIPHLERYLTEGRPTLLAGRGDARGALLVNERGNPLTSNHLLRLVADVATRAGLSANPHALRRSVATHLVRGGASHVAVQHLLGHVRLDTTQRYLGVCLDDLRAAVEALPTS